MNNGLPWGESPIDVEDDQTPGYSWTARIFIASSALLIVFNSHAIANWANQLTISSRTAPLITAAVQWHEETGNLGFNFVVAEVERQAKSVRKLTWSDFSDGPKASADLSDPTSGGS
jgi:hypothetical protein